MEENANKFWYFRCLKYGVFLYTDCEWNFPCHCSFTYLLLWSIYGIRNSSQQKSLQCLSTNNMVFSDEDEILMKSLYLKKYTTKRLTDEFPEKAGQSMVLISCWKSCGTQGHFTEPPNATTQQPALFRATHILPKKITIPLNALHFKYSANT